MLKGEKMIEEELIKAFLSDDFENEVEETVLSKFCWDSVQDALISMLTDDRYTHSDYEKIADVFWGAVLDEKEIKKEAVIGLLYYRLGKKEAPYENNVIWSIASKVYGLEYGNSEYNPLQDQKILAELKKVGI